MTIKEIRDKVAKYFSTRPEIKVGYIFGSRARGKENKLSDIDIAILVDEEKVPNDLPFGYKANIITELIQVLRTQRVDLVILNESPLFLCFCVIRDGLILYSNDEKRRVDFEVKVMSRYFDQQYYYERHAELTINRIAKEGIL
jgi:hypothetical protein